MTQKKFKTSAKCSGCVAAIGEELNTVLTPSQWTINLSSTDKTLTVNADIDDDRIMELVRSAGFKIEKL